MSDEESWNDGNATGGTESGSLISDVLQSLSDPEVPARLIDLPYAPTTRVVEEDDESVTKYADLCSQFLRLDEEEDLSIGARTVDHGALFMKDRPPGVELPRQPLEYACEHASCSANLYKADEDGLYRSGSNGIGTCRNETSEAVQFDAWEVDEAGSVDVFELYGTDIFYFDEVPLSDANTEELRDVPPSPGLSEASVDGTGRYFTMSKGKCKEGTDCADPPPMRGGLHSTKSGGKWKGEADLEDPPLEDDEEPIERPIAETNSEWVKHNTPLLEEYAKQQINPPLGKRVDVELGDATQFVLGMFQMPANRGGIKEKGKKGRPNLKKQDLAEAENVLLDGFVDIQKWADEYLRVRFGQESTVIGALVPTLLTMIVNSFYEAQMVLLDNIVSKALELKNDRLGSSLEVSDFAFGFDFKMTQELPFLAEASCRVRETPVDKAAEILAVTASINAVTEKTAEVSQRSSRGRGTGHRGRGIQVGSRGNVTSSRGRPIRPRKLADSDADEGEVVVTPIPSVPVQRKKQPARRAPNKAPMKASPESEVDVESLPLDHSEIQSGTETMLNSPADTLIALDGFDDVESLFKVAGGSSTPLDSAKTSTSGGSVEKSSIPPPTTHLYRRYDTRPVARVASSGAPRLTVRIPRLSSKLSVSAARLSPLGQLCVNAIPDPEEPSGATVPSISDTGRARKKRKRDE
ncbi:uncharacterized protein LACBIDRAFT_323133 [Laccaria bicolor S238N-H82]|uniref:Predicted protein n=1 Tax=Laccaria bicolor (strain S238N-H82 / ATCC MYA-4686) TaxID=486041 RepID=B0CZ82_LACBS|nr:uncharacterized protein LACBIDRAFT_323133 [Laccaria bicolor S238N-H82]EDR12105.1 predicted protein [Laccaria bicolor S238N-H82]|eukprot:XP_001876369.1 predicted protein [Laccaria bicolor S238N-H82]